MKELWSGCEIGWEGKMQVWLSSFTCTFISYNILIGLANHSATAPVVPGGVCQYIVPCWTDCLVNLNFVTDECQRKYNAAENTWNQTQYTAAAPIRIVYVKSWETSWNWSRMSILKIYATPAISRMIDAFAWYFLSATFDKKPLRHN